MKERQIINPPFCEDVRRNLTVEKWREFGSGVKR